MHAEIPLLTFAIPTYNRHECLKLLLDALLPEVAEANSQGLKVEVLVCNNASPDGTAAYLDGLAGRSGLRVAHHPQNLGPDANAIFCFEQARGQYVWIFGDDDLPLPGALSMIVKSLERDQPDLLFLPAHWHVGELNAYLDQRAQPGTPVAIDAMALALEANAYTTFISSWVANRLAYQACATPPDPARYLGTSLPQLEWTLALLSRGRRLFVSRQEWVIARGANSGGYPVFKVFVTNYSRVVNDRLQAFPALREFLCDFMLRSYLPGFVWGLRQDTVGQFADVDRGTLEAAVRATWPNAPVFVGVLERIGRWPKPWARLAFGCSWLYGRMWLGWLRLRLAGKRGQQQ